MLQGEKFLLNRAEPPSENLTGDRIIRVDRLRGVCLLCTRTGYTVHGIDNNQSAVFFGPGPADTRWKQHRLHAN